jgi:hypothetical protein
MLKKHMKYTDYDGNIREEDFYFNLTKAEIVFLEMEMPGGMKKYLEKITGEMDAPAVAETFKKILGKAYGIKSDDGKRFIKSAAHSNAFEQTEAYSDLIVEMIMDPTFAANFIEGMMPSADQDTPKQVSM